MVLIGNHVHIDAGVDRGDYRLVVVIGDLVDGSPIRHYKSAEPEFSLQNIGE
jgi:hypothetical protein